MKTIYTFYPNFSVGIKRLVWGVLITMLTTLTTYAQTYQVNGSAVNQGGGLVRMTAASIGNQTASAWSTTRIDLTQPFDMSFDMFFGCDAGANGGDGMTFTFHNDPRALNALGEGFGYLGVGGGPAVTPSISIEFDTYDGTAAGGLNELAADHIAIDINGNVNNTTNTFVGPGGSVTRQAIRGGRDLEDCAQNTSNYYTIRVVWTPGANTLQLYEEGVLTMTYTSNLITTVFGGNNMVYWGFTGSTGSASNEQWIAPTGSIIPWQCATNSCCTAYTLNKTGPTTVCNTNITLGVTPSSGSAPTQYNWSTGATTTTLNVNSPGTYTVNVQQLQGASLCPATATFNIAASGATGVMSGGATICNDGTTTTPISVALTGAQPWTITYAIDGVNQTPITGITTSPYVFQGTAPHTYTLTSVTDNTACNGAESGSAVVNAYPALPVGYNNTFIAPGSTTLAVDNSGGTYNWYTAPTGGAPIFTGTNYTTPVLAGTTTYYVENSAITPFTNKSVAYLNRTQYGTGGNNTQTALGLPRFDLWMDFVPTTNFTLNSIRADVNITASPQTGGSNVTVYISDNGGPPTSFVIPVSGQALGTQSILATLNYPVVAGHTYRISYEGAGSVQGIMYWDFIGARGPWGANPAATITKDPELTIRVPNQGWYPGMFDWQITAGSAAASCGRTPVTAIANTPAPIQLLYFHAKLIASGRALLQWSTALEVNNHYFTIERSTDGIHFTAIGTLPGAGNSSSTLLYNTIDEHALSGISYYRIKQTDYNGAFSYSNIESINDQLIQSLVFTLSPNPTAAGSSVFIDVRGAGSHEKIAVGIYDMLGRLLYTNIFLTDELGYLHEDLTTFTSFAKGTYIVAITPSNAVAYNQKLVVY